jgi:hypothetical protein
MIMVGTYKIKANVSAIYDAGDSLILWFRIQCLEKICAGSQYGQQLILLCLPIHGGK